MVLMDDHLFSFLFLRGVQNYSYVAFACRISILVMQKVAKLKLMYVSAICF